MTEQPRLVTDQMASWLVEQPETSGTTAGLYIRVLLETRAALMECLEGWRSRFPVCAKVELNPSAPTCLSPVPAEFTPPADYCFTCYTRTLLTSLHEGATP